MAGRIVVGEFFREAQQALDRVEELNRKYGRDKYAAVGFDGGLLVLSNRQINEFNLKVQQDYEKTKGNSN